MLKVGRWRPKKVEKVKTCETMQSIAVLSNVILGYSAHSFAQAKGMELIYGSHFLT